MYKVLKITFFSQIIITRPLKGTIWICYKFLSQEWFFHITSSVLSHSLVLLRLCLQLSILLLWFFIISFLYELGKLKGLINKFCPGEITFSIFILMISFILSSLLSKWMLYNICKLGIHLLFDPLLVTLSSSSWVHPLLVWFLLIVVYTSLTLCLDFGEQILIIIRPFSDPCFFAIITRRMLAAHHLIISFPFSSLLTALYASFLSHLQ